MTKEQTVGQYLEALSSKEPTPGGGGASGLAGALGSALGLMVGNLTVGKKRYADVEEDVRKRMGELLALQADFLHLADRDAEVFAPLAAAYGLPTDTEEERRYKDEVMEENLLEASLVPLKVMECTMMMLEILEDLEQKGSAMAVSDVGVAVQFARTALSGAVMNVYINTRSMKDRDKAAELNEEAYHMMTAGAARADELYSKILERLVN